MQALLQKLMKREKIKKKERNHGDYLMVVAVFLLSIIGLIFIYSASSYSAKNTYDDSLFFVKKQIIGILVGFIVFISVNLFDYNKLQKVGITGFAISCLLLLLVFVPHVGKESYGAKRWISLGGITIQPSEIAKLGYILFCSFYLNKTIKKVNNFIKILPIIISGIIVCFLIILEPNMSICVCFALLMISYLFISGTKVGYIISLIVPALFLGIFLIISEPYRLNRLSAFLNPWASPKGEGYQLLQSLYALGSGGMFGVGLFNSRQKFSFLPFSESDFILSIVGEETGFFGIFLLFLLYFFIIYRGIKIALSSKDIYGYYLAMGITLIFAIQVIVNALVVSGSIPPTGLPLPLMSSGNTSIMVFYAEFGILYNVSKSDKNKNYISKLT